jgi:hypothetical protein
MFIFTSRRCRHIYLLFVQKLVNIVELHLTKGNPWEDKTGDKFCKRCTALAGIDQSPLKN